MIQQLQVQERVGGINAIKKKIFRVPEPYPSPTKKIFFLEYPNPTQFGRGKYPSPTKAYVCTLA